MEDSEIVGLYLSRDETAIARTAEQYGRKLRQLANRILHDPASAEECENDTYLEAWNRIPPQEPRTWLFAFLGKITRHLAIDLCRKNAAQKRRGLFCELTAEMEACIPGRDCVEADVEREMERDALGRSINAFLGTCPEGQRHIFVRRYWYFDTIPDICGRYGYSPSKVKTTLFRMRERLRKHLEKEGFTV